MTRGLLASGAHDDSRPTAAGAPIELSIDDSLRFFAMPVRRVSAAMVAVLAGSLAFHALIVSVALMTTRTLVAAPSREIPVEIVQDVPKPVAHPDPARTQHAKREETPAKPAMAPAAASPQRPQTVQPQPAAPKAGSSEIEALQKELAALRAQKAALQAAPSSQTTLPSQTDEAHAKGPMADSSRAVALPSIGENGEMVGYQDLVFSQLAKAKGSEDYHGEAGTTGVRFDLDTAGRLLSVDIIVTSGNPALDKKALEIVHRAAPFPPPPKGAENRFFANVNFVPPKS